MRRRRRRVEEEKEETPRLPSEEKRRQEDSFHRHIFSAFTALNSRPTVWFVFLSFLLGIRLVFVGRAPEPEPEKGRAMEGEAPESPPPQLTREKKEKDSFADSRNISTPCQSTRPSVVSGYEVVPPAPRKGKGPGSPKDRLVLQARSLNFGESSKRRPKEKQGLPRVKELEKYFRRLDVESCDAGLEANMIQESNFEDLDLVNIRTNVTASPKSDGVKCTFNFLQKRKYGDISITVPATPAATDCSKEQKIEWLD